jgi:hypothetical protein
MISINKVFKRFFTSNTVDIDFLVLNQDINQSTYERRETNKIAFIQPLNGELQSGMITYSIFNCWIDKEQLTETITNSDRIILNNTIYSIVDVELHNNLQNIVIKPFYKLIIEKVIND